MQRTPGANWETYSVQEIVSTQLLALIEEQAVYKFIVCSENIEDLKEALFVSNWIYDIKYTMDVDQVQALGIYTRHSVFNINEAPTTSHESFL